MRFREIHPHWEMLPTGQLLNQIGFDVLSALIHRIADWYKVNLPMWAVLYHVGYTGKSEERGGPRYPRIGPETDPDDRGVQVSCMLPLHGSGDHAPSARYYVLDRNEHTRHGHIFCFGPKCKKAYTSFWYLYTMMKGHDKIRYSDVILYIEQAGYADQDGVWHTYFGVPFPRHIVLDADPQRLGDDERLQAVDREERQRFVQARLLRERVRPENRGQYLAALSALYTSPLQCMSVDP